MANWIIPNHNPLYSYLCWKIRFSNTSNAVINVQRSNLYSWNQNWNPNNNPVRLNNQNPNHLWSNSGNVQRCLITHQTRPQSGRWLAPTFNNTTREIRNSNSTYIDVWVRRETSIFRHWSNLAPYDQLRLSDNLFNDAIIEVWFVNNGGTASLRIEVSPPPARPQCPPGHCFGRDDGSGSPIICVICGHEILHFGFIFDLEDGTKLVFKQLPSLREIMFISDLLNLTINLEHLVQNKEVTNKVYNIGGD